MKSISQLLQERSSLIGSLTFNKDDDLILDFVSSAANIRAYNFSIPFEVIDFYIKHVYRANSR